MVPRAPSTLRVRSEISHTGYAQAVNRNKGWQVIGVVFIVVGITGALFGNGLGGSFTAFAGFLFLAHAQNWFMRE